MRPISVIYIFLLLSFCALSTGVSAQIEDSTQLSGESIYIITTHDGLEFIGTIKYQDSKEVIVVTKKLGEVSIPKYQIREIKKATDKDFSGDGTYVPEEIFATRYFLTTNGLGLKKSESYVVWNLYGPDIQFGVADNFSVGLMTSWFGMPIIGTAKYSFNVTENVNIAAGLLAGTGSWAIPDFGLMMPFGALTFGDRRHNLNFAAGYGTVWFDQDNASTGMFSIGGLSRISKKVSFVFDSFIIPERAGVENSGTLALLIPGFRIQNHMDRAFQFGFAGFLFEGEAIPLAIPMVQWFRRF